MAATSNVCRYVPVKFKKGTGADCEIAIGDSSLSKGIDDGSVDTKDASHQEKFVEAWKNAAEQALHDDHVEAQKGLRRVNILLKHGFNPNFLWGDTETALGMACSSVPDSRPRIPKEDADGNAVRPANRGYELETSNINLANLLLDQGAGLNGYPEHESRFEWLFDKLPLVLAVQAGNIEVARTLLRRGADATRVDGEGNTILFYAMNAVAKDWEVGLDLIKSIVLAGCSMAVKNKDGSTCIEAYENVLSQGGDDDDDDDDDDDEDDAADQANMQEGLPKVIEWLQKEGEKVAHLLTTPLEQHDESEINHVMISYSWSDQTGVMRVKETLEKKGIKCFMDEEKERGVVLQGTVPAVEMCDVFLFFASGDYWASATCRLECEHAIREQKIIIPIIVEADFEPTLWLEPLMRNKLVYDVSNMIEDETQLSSLVEAVEKQVNQVLAHPRMANIKFPKTQAGELQKVKEQLSHLRSQTKKWWHAKQELSEAKREIRDLKEQNEKLLAILQKNGIGLGSVEPAV